MDLEATIVALAPRLLRYCLGLTGESSLAEEISQDALTALVNRWRRLGPPDCAEAFAFSIARRRVRRAQWKQRFLLPLETLTNSGDPAPDPEISTAQKRDLARTLAAIEQLPRKNREALLLIVAGEVSVATAARLLGVSHSAIKMRVHRARRQLTEILEVCHEAE